jgi:hypothetical protein
VVSPWQGSFPMKNFPRKSNTSWIGKNVVHGTGSILLPENRKIQKCITERKRKAGRKITAMRYFFIEHEKPGTLAGFFYSSLLTLVLSGFQVFLPFALAGRLHSRFVILGLCLSLSRGLHMLRDSLNGA